MKRIKPKKKAALRKLLLRRQRKHAYRCALKVRRKHDIDGEYSKRLSRRKSRHIPIKIITVPSVICLDHNQAETIDFINGLHFYLQNKGTKIRLDFSELKSISPAAALMLASVLYCWSKKSHQQITLHDQTQWDPMMRHLLNDMGLFDLMNVKNPPSYSEKAEPTKEFLRFCSGNNVDASPYGPFREKIVETFGPISDMKKLYKAISEAMTNSFQHAYPLQKHKLGFGCWWMFGAYDWTTKELTISFCDLGIGIPKALPRKYSLEYLRELLSMVRMPVNDDAKMIKAAMEIKRTQTKKGYRGKGMPGMKEIINANPSSCMRVYSSGGMYEYAHSTEEKIQGLKGVLPGTIIEWRFLLSAVEAIKQDPEKAVA
ncbi:MAG: hypothetical protein AB7S81_00125 [Bdellovibrionales bacterium]